jgi:two-component system NtrC family sensor kinase
METQNLIEQLQQQIQIANLINQINNQIRTTLDLDEVLNSACELLAYALQANRVNILVKESEKDDFVIAIGEYKSANYPSQKGASIPITGNAHLQTLMEQPEILAVRDLPNFPGLDDHSKKIIEKGEIKSNLAVATRYQGKVNGVVSIQQCDRYREWKEWEKELLNGVAFQLAIAINQAQLYAETRRQAERESLLRFISSQIRSSLDLPTILNTAVRKVRQLLNTDRVVIYQFKGNWSGEVVVEDLLVPWPAMLGDQIVDNCFREEHGHLYEYGRVKAIDDIYNSGLDPCHVNFLDQLQVKANLIVPIVMKKPEQNSDNDLTGNLWGLLIAHECHQKRNWRRYEIELMRKLGEQIAVAIQQSELYGQVQKSSQKFQSQAEELAKTLQELKETQQQLIQTEKMSSLGQMVAGIAHEINNANNFINANLFHVEEYLNIFSEVIDRCASLNPEVGEFIEHFNDEFDLNYIREDLPNIVKSMREGSIRIRSIVEQLRSFSRLDEAEVKSVDIHEGIDSCLTLLQHRLKSGIKVEKQYGNIPLIQCHAGQINQVLFNLLVNAIDAMASDNIDKKLIIKTEYIESNTVRISIKDKGLGIPDEIKNRIFDPFFTTKPIGQGTGMGLAICYQIIVKTHGGKIICNSEVNQGTEMVVELPIS